MTKVNKFQKLYLKNAVKRKNRLKGDGWTLKDVKRDSKNKFIYYVIIKNVHTGDTSSGEVIYNIS